jgi:hypothetical protein
MSALSRRLGHNKVSQLIALIESNTAMNMNLMTDCDSSLQSCPTPQGGVNCVPPEEAHLAYVECMFEFSTHLGLSPFDQFAKSVIYAAYFEEVHPVYPFLDKEWFLEMVGSRCSEQTFASNKPFTALFYTVAALGCMCCDGCAFRPGKWLAWELFSLAIGLYADVILSKKPLLSMQVSAPRRMVSQGVFHGA